MTSYWRCTITIWSCLYCFRDKARYWSKIANFVRNAPSGWPVGICTNSKQHFLFVKSGRYHSAASPSSLSKNYVFIENTQCFYIELDFGVTPSECRPDRNNIINPLIATLKPQSKKTLYNNTVIGTLAVDGWAVTFDTARRGMVGAAARPGPSSLYQM